jgi:uncharacterized protein (DUF927 family)
VSATPPVPLSEVPLELKLLPRWVGFKLEPDDKRPSKFKKIPINPNTGRGAEANDPSTWGTFEEALAACEKYGCDGVGFEFLKDDSYTGVDLDDCVGENGRLSPEAFKIVADLDSYTEFSPSGKGVHVIVRASKPGKKCTNKSLPGMKALEMYDRDRYFTITGNLVPGCQTSVERRQDEIDELYNSTWPAPAAADKEDGDDATAGLGFQGSDEELIAAIKKAKNGDKISKLLDGDFSGYASQSEADAALMRSFAFWTDRNAERMERLFRQSKLYRADKGSDYLRRTIKFAIENTKEGYDPGIARGFRVNEKGVFRVEPDKGDDSKTVWKPVCSPMRVIGLGRDSDQTGWQIAVEFEDPDNYVHRELIPAELLGGDGSELCRLLCSWGVRIDSKALICEYLRQARPPLRVRTVKKIGWHGEGVFVLPGKNFGETEEGYFYLGAGRHLNSFLEKGSVEEWREKIGKYCMGNSRLLFAASLGFTGPLLPMAPTASPGFHLVGVSSIGKSTALLLSGSVCGGEHVKTWRATTNGVEIMAEMHNHNLLCLDEMAQVDPRVVGEMAYMLCNGQGKSRMQRNTSAARVLTWQLAISSTGEVSLEEHANEVGKKIKAGQRVRIVDVPADAGKGHGLFENLHEFPDGRAFADYLKDACKSYHGSPLHSFMELVVSKRGEIERNYRAKVKRLESMFAKLGTSGEVSRVATHFALVGAAGEIATELGVTGFTPGACEAAAAECFKGWLTRRGTTGSSDEDAMVRQVRRFIEQHGDSRFVNLGVVYEDESRRPRVFNRVGFLTPDGEYLFMPEVFKKEVCAGFDPTQVVKALEDAGFLLPETNGEKRKQARRLISRDVAPELKGNGQDRFYVVKATIIGDLPDQIDYLAYPLDGNRKDEQ